jgi:hypothetical protein
MMDFCEAREFPGRLLPTQHCGTVPTMKISRLVVLVCMLMVVAMAVYGAAPTSPFTQCPPVGADKMGCQLLVVVSAVNSSGAATAFNVFQSTTDLGPFDGTEDTLIGVLNSSTGTLKSITLFGGTGSGVFLFDADGACFSATTYTPAPPAAQCPGGAYTTADPGDYASINASFGTIVPSGDSGTINLGGAAGLAVNGSAWFDLEGVINAQQIGGSPPPTPAPSTVWLVVTGLAAVGIWQLRRSLAGRTV